MTGRSGLQTGRLRHALLAFPVILAGCQSEPVERIDQLAAQLDGGACIFEHDGSQCRARSPGLTERLLGLVAARDSQCELWAVHCLGDEATPQAYTLLAGVLKEKADVQTCDGVVPVRSEAARLLGQSGDPAMAPALEAYVASDPRQVLSSGATGCDARPEDIRPAIEAIRKLTAGE
ncbi:MAG TPA: HEAT repeat domain-containing protein [Rhizobiaceae bacterium]|nr:HEAT repeat domain-containing protein [Rhizobiaceae bacterium]